MTGNDNCFSTWDQTVDLYQSLARYKHLGKKRILAPGDTLYRQGSTHPCFYLVEKGYLHTRLLRSDGTELLLEIYGPKTLFGEASAFVDAVRSVTAQAVTAAELIEYDVKDIHGAIEKDPSLAISIIQLLGIKHCALLEKLMYLTKANPCHRVVGLLSRIAQLNAVEFNQSVTLNLTHQNLSSMTALSRVAVTRTLQKLEADGLIKTGYGKITVLSLSDFLTSR